MLEKLYKTTDIKLIINKTKHYLKNTELYSQAYTSK